MLIHSFCITLLCPRHASSVSIRVANFTPRPSPAISRDNGERGNDDIIGYARIINEPRKYVYPIGGSLVVSTSRQLFLLFIRRELRRRVRRTGLSPTSSSFVRRDRDVGGFCERLVPTVRLAATCFTMSPRREGRRETSRAINVFAVIYIRNDTIAHVTIPLDTNSSPPQPMNKTLRASF